MSAGVLALSLPSSDGGIRHLPEIDEQGRGADDRGPFPPCQHLPVRRLGLPASNQLECRIAAMLASLRRWSLFVDSSERVP
eukprot:2222327-Pyramimonas_sp.AAC.1